MEKIGDEKETAGAGGGDPALELGGQFMFNVVTGDEDLARFANAVNDFDLLFFKESRRDRLLCQSFFFDRP